MMTRWLLLVVGLVGLTPMLQAQEPAAKPALTFQLQPVSKLLQDAKTFAQTLGEDGSKQLEDTIKEKLGEKGFTGLDLTRPIVGYSELTDEAVSSGAVAIVPITDEKDFLDFLTRAKIIVEESKTNKGLYKLTPKDPPADNTKDQGPSALRFKNRSAYIAFNVPEETLAAAKLIAPEALLTPNETAQFAYKLHMDRIPEKLRKDGLESLDKAVKDLKNLPGADSDTAKEAQSALGDMYKRLGEQVLREGETAFVRVRFDPMTGEVALEGALTAKAGTKLAKDIAARKAPVHQFAGLLTKDSAAGVLMSVPLFAPEIGKMVIALLDKAKTDLDNNPPPPELKPLVTEAFEGLTRTVKAGTFDIAATIYGPGKDDALFTAALGVSFEDPSKLEKLVRDLHKKAPEPIQKAITIDAAKVGSVSIHTIDVATLAELAGGIPEPAKQLFGQKPTACIAFTPKAILITFGAASQDAITSAIKLEPQPGRPFDIAVNPNRLKKLMEAANPGSGAKVVELLGTDDKLASIVSFAIEGGEELRIRMTLNVKMFPRAGIAGSAPAAK